MKIAKYKYEDMEKALNVLNSITVTGIENCKKIAYIAQIMQSMTEEDAKDGND